MFDYLWKNPLSSTSITMAQWHLQLSYGTRVSIFKSVHSHPQVFDLAERSLEDAFAVGQVSSFMVFCEADFSMAMAAGFR